jgi:CDP-glucose 4,6-dehydratase
MAELVIDSYQKSYFNRQPHLAGVASVRAGNVIGGGDFAEFRLVPDIMKSLMAKNSIILRNPSSIRPWQHVLIPLSGYLSIAEHLLRDKTKHSQAWNFAPLEVNGVNVLDVTKKLISLWGSGSFTVDMPSEKVETVLLKLNWEKAAYFLGWSSAYNLDESLAETAKWFKAYEQKLASGKPDMYSTCQDQILNYTLRAKQQSIPWAN